MSVFRNTDGTPAVFVVDDGLGNTSVGHFEAMTVPSFEPGTRISDLQFVIDRVQTKADQSQIGLQQLRGATT